MGVDKSLLSSVLVLLLQTHSSWVECKMVAPSQPIVVPVGSDVTLPCQLDSVRDLRNLVVEWSRPDLKPPYVHIRRDGLDLLLEQNSLYQGRSRLTERQLQNGDMSLQLSRARLSDGGTYKCYVPQMDTAAQVTLYVVSVSPVSLTLTKDHSGSPVLRCESRGWYPKPELDWLDSEGKNLSRGRTEVTLSKDESFSVSSRLSVEQNHGKSFTCRVRQPESAQSRQADVIIKDEFLEVLSCSVAWTLFALCLVLFVAAAVVFVVWKFKLLNRGKKSVNKDTELGEREEQKSMMEPDEDTYAPKTAVSVSSSDMKSSDHKENSKKIEEDLKFLKEVIIKLTETKDFIMKLKQKPQEVINLLDPQIDAIKKKSYSKLNPMKDEKEKERDEWIGKLEKQKQECMNTIVEIDNQVRTTDTVLMEAAQRKGKLKAECDSEKRREEAAAGPEPQPERNERKTNVPVATIQAVQQIEGSTGKTTEEEGNVDGLTDAIGKISIKD